MTLANELDRLLCEPAASVALRAASHFDDAAGPQPRGIVLMGSGELGRKALRVLRRAGCEPLAFADNKRALWGSSIDGLTVLSPREAAERFGTSAAFVATIWSPGFTFEHARSQLVELGCKRVVPVLALMWKFPSEFLPHYRMDRPERIAEHAEEVRRAFSLWADELSRRIYVGFVRWQLMCDYGALVPPVDDRFHPAGVAKPTPEEVFVDCGAYDGDTLVEFARRTDDRFARMVGLEPDPSNFARLQERVGALPVRLRKRIEVRHCAVGPEPGKLPFAASGTMAAALVYDEGQRNTEVKSSTLTVDCTRLDDLFPDAPPTYVKMDIEGAEEAALRGAGRLIEEGRTLWAVTTEHRQEDVWRIPWIIASRSDGYRMHLRSHDFEGTDLVCYAVPRRRQA